MPFNMLPVTSKDDRYASEKHGGDSVALTVAKPTGDSSFGVVMQSYSNESGVLVAELREGKQLREILSGRRGLGLGFGLGFGFGLGLG